VTDYLPLLHIPVLVLLNLNSEDYPMRLRSHRMERAIVLAASLVVHFLALGQEVGLIASARLGPTGELPAARIRGGHEHAAVLLEYLARMEAEPGSRDFTELLFTTGIELPARTRLEVITPVFSEPHRARLRQIREKGCTVETFLLAEPRRGGGPEAGGEFPVFPVQDFGDELIHH
jgi:uncharacterized protein (DUF58 family)